jgi:hypothetical protein
VKARVAVLGILALVYSGAGFGVPPDNSGDIAKHLEFLGYQVKVDDHVIQALHPARRHFNMVIKKYRGGMLVDTFFRGSDYGKSHMDAWLTLINKLNKKAAAARYYIDDDGDMIIEGYYPGEYNKQAFATFLDAFDLERSHMVEFATEIKMYVK